MANPPDEPKILLDSDVVRHFLKGGQIFNLVKIFPKRFVMLDIVKNELCRSKSLVTQVENFLNFTKVELVNFPSSNVDIVREYAYLISTGRGEGEGACMAVARFEQKFVASSNLADIKYYCELHGITYYTTMDLLHEGYKNNVFTEQECDDFIKEVVSKGSKLPFSTIKEFIQNNTKK